QAGTPYRLDAAGVRGSVTVHLKDVPLPTALQIVLRQADPPLVYRVDGGTFVISPRQPPPNTQHPTPNAQRSTLNARPPAPAADGTPLAGLTPSRNGRSCVCLDVSGQAASLRKTLHHELFHAVDHVTGQSLDRVWDSFNPPGFQYTPQPPKGNPYGIVPDLP